MTRISRLVLALCATSALGFGASQAFARPAPPAKTAARSCSQGTCDLICQHAGYTDGACIGTTCVCS
jgi:hypothetical protein